MKNRNGCFGNGYFGRGARCCNGLPTLGSSRHFSEIFRYLMQLSQTKSFTLVIDEFQDFYRVNKAVYSEMQNIWDEYEKLSKINLVVCGSIYSLMQKIFKNKKEPLYGRNTAELRVKPFRPSVLNEWKKYDVRYKGLSMNDM